jgi:hypothetical protein
MEVLSCAFGEGLRTEIIRKLLRFQHVTFPWGRHKEEKSPSSVMQLTCQRFVFKTQPHAKPG